MTNECRMQIDSPPPPAADTERVGNPNIRRLFVIKNCHFVRSERAGKGKFQDSSPALGSTLA